MKERTHWKQEESNRHNLQKSWVIQQTTKRETMLVKVETYHDGEFWCARGIGFDVFTQGKTLDELMENVKEAVELHFDDVLISGEDIKILSLSEIEVRSVA